MRETLVGHGAMDSELWRDTEANGGRPSVGVDFKPRGLEQRGEVGQAIVPSDGRNAIEVEHHRPEALDWRVHVVGSGIATLVVEDGVSELLDSWNVGEFEVASQRLPVSGVGTRAPDAVRNGPGVGNPVCDVREV